MSRSDHWLGNIQICKNVGDWSKSTRTLTTNKNLEVLGANIMKNWAIRTRSCSHRDWAPKSWSRVITAINQLRATAGTRNIWKIACQIKSCATAKAKICWFQSTSLEVDPSNSVYQKKELWIRPHSKHVTKILRHASCHESDGINRWDHVLTNMPSAEQTQNWDKEKLIDALWTRNDCLRPCNKKAQPWCQNQSNIIFFERETLALERTHIPQGQLFQIFNNLGEWSFGKKIKSGKHETSLLLLTSESARFDQLDKTSSWTKNGFVHAKLSPRSWLCLVVQSTTSSRRNYKHFITVVAMSANQLTRTVQSKCDFMHAIGLKLKRRDIILHAQSKIMRTQSLNKKYSNCTRQGQYSSRPHRGPKSRFHEALQHGAQTNIHT